MKLTKFFFHKSANEKDFDSEIRFHLDSFIEEKVAAGMLPQEARRLAALEFGGTEQVKEECRSVHRLPLVENLFTNLKAAIRFMRRAPGFSATVIVTIALGVGANSAVFSAIDAILLRPLSYPASNQLVILHQRDRAAKDQSRPIAPVRLEEWNRYNSTLQGIAGSYVQDLSESSGTIPERLLEADVTPRFLQVLGVAPEVGRDFTLAEEHFGGPSAVLISHRFWRRRFHYDPLVVGRAIRLESVAVPIVGVLPASFQFPDKDVDI